MQNKPELPHYAIGSVDNALRLLLLFRDHDVLRVTDASVELGVARSTAHRLLMTLAHQGFVQQERSSRSYRIGPSLMEFQVSLPGMTHIRDVARNDMVELSRHLQETMNLMVLEGDSIRFIDSVECDRQVRVTGRTGRMLPAHATAGGKVLLAAMEGEEVRSRLATSLRKITSATITGKITFYEELDDVRRLGYAINRGESLEGLHAAAVSIIDHSGRTVAALAVSVPADRGGTTRLRKHIPALREAAKDIGQRL